jgi:hypothetical protein
MMRIAKRLLVVAILTAMFSPLLACGDAVGASQADMTRQRRRAELYDKQMLVDDVALLTLTHRPFRNTRWIMD